MNLEQICLDSCSPKQIININNEAFNDISIIEIYNDCNAYDKSTLEYSYSIDDNCWSCFMKYNDFLNVTVELKQDYYIRIRIAGPVTKITINGENWPYYSTQLDSSFSFSEFNTAPNNYNPYINMDCGIALYQFLTESVVNQVGIGCYYFKLSPNVKSKDMTFKEYALMDVSAVKQVKIIIMDNQMPSSKPEFSDFGLDWQTDWEVEVSKTSFATAFGNKVMPTEGDLIYIPMMKRMWMVNGAYEEKKDAFMWNAATFKLMLVKYQEKASVDLGDTEELVDSFVKNKYEDLFGEEESNVNLFDAANNEPIVMGNLYNVYTADAIRKSIDINNVTVNENKLYYKGTLITDNIYNYNIVNKNALMIEYQQKYCGNSGSLSFIININTNTLFGVFESKLISIGNLIIKIKQNSKNSILSCSNCNTSITILNGKTYFVFLRWDKQLNCIDFGAAEYKYIESLPIYKLQPAHYWFELDNLYQHKVVKYNIEMNVPNKSSLCIFNHYGQIGNIKLCDAYIENLYELLQMYPSINNIVINDSVRQLNNILNGSSTSI
jgi:hypothetical protein